MNRKVSGPIHPARIVLAVMGALCIALLVLAGPQSSQAQTTPLQPPVPVPGTGSRLFPETGKTVSGIFLRYWERYGGLAQQGYPISEPVGEISSLNGNLYTVQYFERAVFEYHPEYAGTPYEVLLVHVGRFEYNRRYPNGAPGPQPNKGPSSLYFPQTDKWLGGEFLRYWRENGGLAQQGYPISEELTERSELNGELYKVQYFERSVIEIHPELRVPNHILLGHLGRFRYNTLYGDSPVVVTPTTSPGTPMPISTPQILARDVFGEATANDRYTFWVANDRPTYTLYAFDTQEGKTITVTTRPGIKQSLAADDTRLVWVEGEAGSPSSIMGYDLRSGQGFTAVEQRPSGEIGEDRMTLDGTMLFYRGKLGGKWGIIARNIGTKEEQLLIEGGRNPVVSGDVLVWSRERADCPPSGPPCLLEQELYVRKAGKDTRLASSLQGEFHFEEYAAHGDFVIWVSPGAGPGQRTLHMYRISDGADRLINAPGPNNPLVRDDIAVWGGYRAGGLASLNVYDISTFRTVQPIEAERLVYPRAFLGSRSVLYIVGPSGSNLPTGGDLYLLRVTPPGHQVMK